MKNSKNFYITTPIYYVTAKPHLGSLYSTVIADIIARWERMHAKNVFFLTGTDEHGQKVANAAKQDNKDPQLFVDEFIPIYKKVWQQYDICYERFMRTTDSDHIKGAQFLIEKLIKKGDIYKDVYKGWYCTSCETFIQEDKQTTPPCTSCGRATYWLEETSYFFKLSAYQDKLLNFYAQNPHFITPPERLNELISFVKEGLKDLSMSRTTVKWGVPFPTDPEHTIYVWAEALTNYITAIGYGDAAQQALFEQWWPADVHVLGKDIVRFHAVCWPALLMAAGLALPKKLLVHGWIQVNKQKMSKSLNNVIDPVPLGQKYGTDQIRYFFARYVPINQDGDFNNDALEQAIESDLANDLGNLVNRMTTLACKYQYTTLHTTQLLSPLSLDIHHKACVMTQEYSAYFADYQFHLALGCLWKFINQVNSYFHNAQPWQLAKNDSEQFEEVICTTAHSLHTVALLLWPVLPQKMTQLLSSLGVAVITNKDQNAQSFVEFIWSHSYTITIIPPLFEKPVTAKALLMKDKELPVMVDMQHLQHNNKTYITIEDFTKVKLVVGTIQECVVVENSDKLLKMHVDLGIHPLVTIFAGLKKWFNPQDLIGKQGVFVANLKPRSMLGSLSEGMMLVVHDAQGKPSLLSVPDATPNGTQLK